MTLARLLATGSHIESHSPHHSRVIEIGDVRIVKRNVSVLAEADKGQVNWRGEQQFRIAPNVGIDVESIGCEIVNATWMDFVHEACLDPEAKAGLMLWREADYSSMWKSST